MGALDVTGRGAAVVVDGTIGTALLVAFEANAARQIVVGVFGLIFFELRGAL
jgi:hypothetical protein